MKRVLSPRLQSLSTYWNRARGLRLRPERADIDPAAISRAVLPNVLMLDVLAEDHFRYRLIGTGITHAVGRDLTGQSITSAWYGQSHQLLTQAYRHIATTGQPMHATGEGRWKDHHWKLNAVMLPLGPVDKIDILLGACEFERLGRTNTADSSAEILSLEPLPLLFEVAETAAA